MVTSFVLFMQITQVVTSKGEVRSRSAELAHSFVKESADLANIYNVLLLHSTKGEINNHILEDRGRGAGGRI